MGEMTMGIDDGPDAIAARQARDEGIGAAAINASPRWTAAARLALTWCAVHHDDFTADDVWARLHEVEPATRTHEPAALGPVFLWAAREGLIAKTGELRPSVYRRRHRDLTVWQECP